MYILARQRNGTLYAGVSKNLIKRIRQHMNYQTEGFTPCCDIHFLAYFEWHADMLAAITRRKQIKKCDRA